MIRLFLIFIFLITYSEVEASDVALYLSFKSPVIRANNDTVKLKDVLIIEVLNNDSGFNKDALGEITYFITEEFLDSQRLIEYIAKKINSPVERLRWRGSKQVKINHSMFGIQYQKLGLQIKETLINHLSKQFIDVEVELVNQKNGLNLLKQATGFRIKNLDRVKAKKRTAIWIELLDGTKVISEMPVWFRVKVFANVLLADEDINKHEAMEPNKFSLSLIDVTGRQTKYIQDVSKLNNQWATKNILLGTPLQKSFIADEPLVKRNQNLLVEYKKNNILIQVKGKSMNNGFLGDSILVLIENTKKPVKVRVMAKNRVEVEFSDV